MARVTGQRRAGWIWPVIILLAAIVIGLIAWALLAPTAPETQPTETAPAPAAGPAVADIGDITGDPASFYGKEVSVDGRINRTVGDQGVYLADSSGSGELLAVLDTKMSDAGLTTSDTARFSGTIHQVTGDELDGLATTVDKPTRDALANEKAYLSVSSFDKSSR